MNNKVESLIRHFGFIILFTALCVICFRIEVAFDFINVKQKAGVMLFMILILAIHTLLILNLIVSICNFTNSVKQCKESFGNKKREELQKEERFNDLIRRK